MYDVGTDHAYLPCYAVANGIAKKAYAGDNKPGPLQNARENIRELGLEGKVIPVLADGIGETEDPIDTVVISGLGPDTVLQILSQNQDRGVRQWVVQSNKGWEQIRSFISEHRYTILKERCVKDGYYYQIIVFSQEDHDPYSEEEILLGPLLSKSIEEEYVAYLRDACRLYRKLKEKGSEKVVQPLAVYEAFLKRNNIEQ